MARYTRTPVSTLQGINNELAKVELAMQDTLDRKGTAPNFMDDNLDMNSKRILNLPAPVTGQEPLRKSDIPTGTGVSLEYVDDSFLATKYFLTSQGLSGNYGFFEKGFNYVNLGDVGIDTNNQLWIYVGAGAPTKLVEPGTIPSAPDYTQVNLSTLTNVQATLATISTGVYAVGASLTVPERHDAKFTVVQGGTPNGFDIIDAGNGNTAVLARTNDPRQWGAGGTGSDVTDVIQRMLDVGQFVYCKSDAGETLDWVVSGSLQVKFSNYRFKMTSTVSITQTANNTKLLWSDLDVNHVTYEKCNLRGVGASDTASTVNAFNGKPEAQAYGILFKGERGFTTVDCDVRYFKNDGIRSEYSSDVRHLRPVVRGTYPDADIPDSITSRQQFGISVWASTYGERDSTAQEVREGTATPHGAGNIRIIDSEIGDTAIATCVFPGYNDVQLKGQVTVGSLSQHSVYAYGGIGLQIEGYDYTPDRQEVGVKISNNVLANRTIPRNIRVGSGLIRNTHSPAISIECFDKFDDGTFDIFKSGCFFEDLEIDGPIISDYYDIGLSLACAIGRIGKVRLSNQSGTASLRPPIDLRSFGGEIHDTIINKCDRSAIGGSPTLVKALTLRNNTIIDAARTANSVYLSLAPAVAPMELQASRWYAKGNLVYNPANDEVFRIITTGYTSGTIPTGSGTHLFGTASILYVGLFADMQTFVNLYDNIYDIQEGTLSDQAVSINSPKFTTKVRGDWAENPIVKSQVQGTMELWHNTNLGNASKSAQTVAGYGAIGEGANVYYQDAIPTTGTYEKDDILFFRNRVSGGYIGATCTGRGTPGTWKTFGLIS